MHRLLLACVATGLAATTVSFALSPTPLHGLGAAPGQPATSRWPESTPGEQGLDGERLGRLVDRLRRGEHPGQHALLIVRNGRLVLEEYFDGWQADRTHTLQSVSKSFTSALIGIAIDRGLIRDVHEPVLGFFDDLTGIDNIDERKRAMTLEDLLTMRSGTDYHERGNDSPHHQLNRLRSGWTKFILSRPMVSDPGARFQYDSGGVILMSELIRQRTGAHADAFATEHLFGPLGIEQYDWYRNADGHPHMGGGLDLRPRDMAKLGQLYLQDGTWNGVQVVSADWVRASTRQHVTFSRRSSSYTGYGYLWWMHAPDPAGAGVPIYVAEGFMGQFIFVVPEHDMVVVATARAHGRDQSAALEFLYSDVLPAVRR